MRRERVSEEKAARAVERFENRHARGESMEDVCKAEGISKSVLYYWRAKLNGKPKIVVHHTKISPKEKKQKIKSQARGRAMLFVGSVTEIMEVVRGIQ